MDNVFHVEWIKFMMKFLGYANALNQRLKLTKEIALDAQ